MKAVFSPLTHGSLFSGIGGFDLAAQLAGIETLWQVENDPFCQKVLQKHFPEAKLYGDIKNVSGNELEKVDIISGGFPCQPFSCAGKRRGKDDDRYLWPEMLRIIREVKPSWVVAENVGGLLTQENGLVFENCIVDMEKEGYEVQPLIIPACAVGAPHRRDRVWIIANYDAKRCKKQCWTEPAKTENCGVECDCSYDSNTNISDRNWRIGNVQMGRNGSQAEDEKNIHSRGDQWITEPSVGRVANGIPHRVDRLRGLGNAIVPQVAYQIFKAIVFSPHTTLGLASGVRRYIRPNPTAGNGQSGGGFLEGSC
jgi:DNA (cytosine-5)-methyltransferase 1